MFKGTNPLIAEISRTYNGIAEADRALDSGLGQAFGVSFEKYCSTQCQEIAEPLLQICHAGINQHSILRKAIILPADITEDLNQMGAMISNKKATEGNVRLALQQNNKINAEVAGLKGTMKQLEAAHKEVELVKVRSQLVEAESRLEQSSCTLARAEESATRLKSDYPKEFGASYGGLLQKLISARKKEAQSLIAVADKINEAVAQIEPFTDLTVAAYKSRLEKDRNAESSLNS